MVKCVVQAINAVSELKKSYKRVDRKQDKTSFQAKKLKTLQSSRGIPNIVNGYFFRTPEKNPIWEKI